MELFLAKLLGLYFILMGATVTVRRDSIMPAIRDLARNRALLLVMAVIELAAGIALVLAYPRVAFDLSGVLSVVGYMLVVESLFYLAAPSRTVQRMMGYFNRPMWYVAGGVAAVIAGLYLSAVGFGLA